MYSDTINMELTNDNQNVLGPITDLMTSLAVIFILLLVVYVNKSYAETKQLKDVLEQSKNHALSIKDELRKRLAAVHIPAEDDPEDALGLVYHVRDDTLHFDVDQSVLSQRGTAFLQQFTPRLASVLCTPAILPEVDSVLIEGHTDSDGNDEHNLRLSQDRAYTVWQCMLDRCSLAERQRDSLLKLVSTNGLGERDLLPTGSVPGTEDKPRSRRVEFRIRVKSIEQRHLPFPARLDEVKP